MKDKLLIILVLIFLQFCLSRNTKKENTENYQKIKGISFIEPQEDVPFVLDMAEEFIYEYASFYHWTFSNKFNYEFLKKPILESVYSIKSKFGYDVLEEGYTCLDTIIGHPSYIYIFDSFKIYEVTQLPLYATTREGFKKPERVKLPNEGKLSLHYKIHIIGDGYYLKTVGELDREVDDAEIIMKKENQQWKIKHSSCHKYFTKIGFVNYLKNEIELRKRENRKADPELIDALNRLSKKWGI